jgi:hypothetical protein
MKSYVKRFQPPSPVRSHTCADGYLARFPNAKWTSTAGPSALRFGCRIFARLLRRFLAGDRQHQHLLVQPALRGFLAGFFRANLGRRTCWSMLHRSCGCPGSKTLQLGADFQRLTGPHGPSRGQGLRRQPEQAVRCGKKIRRPLETGITFSSFFHAATSGPGALRGPGGDGRRRCPTPARTHLAQRRIWL